MTVENCMTHDCWCLSFMLSMHRSHKTMTNYLKNIYLVDPCFLLCFIALSTTFCLFALFRPQWARRIMVICDSMINKLLRRFTCAKCTSSSLASFNNLPRIITLEWDMPHAVPLSHHLWTSNPIPFSLINFQTRKRLFISSLKHLTILLQCI